MSANPLKTGVKRKNAQKENFIPYIPPHSLDATDTPTTKQAPQSDVKWARIILGDPQSHSNKRRKAIKVTPAMHQQAIEERAKRDKEREDQRRAEAREEEEEAKPDKRRGKEAVINEVKM